MGVLVGVLVDVLEILRYALDDRGPLDDRGCALDDRGALWMTGGALDDRGRALDDIGGGIAPPLV